MQRDVRQAARDAAPVVLVLALCPILAAFAPSPVAPLARAERLIDAERGLGLFFEPAVHAWVANRPLLASLGGIAYITFHLPVLLGVLAWVWAKRPAAFRLARNTFVAAQTLAVAGYVLVPTAPPRLVPSLGQDATTAGFERLAMSPYAAMPSGHAAFALIAAGTVALLARRRAVRLAALLYPPAVLLEIVATGNHFWLDAAAGAAVAAAGFAVARAIDRGYPPARRRAVREPATGSSPAG
jgi:hypothetical protein